MWSARQESFWFLKKQNITKKKKKKTGLKVIFFIQNKKLGCCCCCCFAVYVLVNIRKQRIKWVFFTFLAMWALIRILLESLLENCLHS